MSTPRATKAITSHRSRSQRPGLTTTFLFAGGTVSVVCLLSVVWQYLWYPRLRRAPLNLLFWRSVADLLFTSQFCVTYIIPAFRVDEAEGGDWERDSPAVCTFLAFLTQFTALAAELWLLVICFDLLIQLTQPFRQTASTAGYHVLVWTVALASGVALVATGQSGESSIRICWVARVANFTSCQADDADDAPRRPFNPANWYLFFAPVRHSPRNSSARNSAAQFGAQFALTRRAANHRCRCSSSSASASASSSSRARGCGRASRRRSTCGCRPSSTSGCTSGRRCCTGRRRRPFTPRCT